MITIPPHVRDVLLRELPSLDFTGAECIGEGWNATAWRVRADSTWYVVRVPKLDWAAGEIERQGRLGPLLRELGFPVPSEWRTFRDQDGAVVAGSYLYIPGQPAPTRGKRTLAVLAREIAAFLTRLHGLAPGFALRECDALALDPWPGRYRKLIATYQSMTGPRTRSWLAQVAARLEMASRSAPANVLVHGDLAPEHVLCHDAGHIVGVLDFSGPQVTDPAIDFGRLMQHWGVPFATLVLQSYGRPVDVAFQQRMLIYAMLEPLRTIEAGVLRKLPRWITWGKRRLAMAAAAETRANAGLTPRGDA